MPETAANLAATEWTRIQRVYGLDRASYGTTRYRRRDSSAPRTLLGHARFDVGIDSRAPVVIEALDPDASAPYRAMGLEFAAATDMSGMDAQSRLAAALATLRPVPDLAEAVGALLGAIHVLKAPGADYDVSHSDPDIPFSVFVGLTPTPGPLDRVRLAEELVHECMHLLLTLLEIDRPLIRKSGELHHSPWQGRLRPTRGVLHGFYVFSSIDAFFSGLSASGELNNAESTHVRNRRQEIAAELRLAANALAESHELTEDGRCFVNELRYKR